MVPVVAQRTEEEARFRREIGVRIREARLGRGMTVREFAAASGVHASQISRFEHGSHLPDASTLLRLAEAFQCTVDWLLTGRADVKAGAPPTSAPLPGLDATLPGFFQAASAFAAWANVAPRDEVPTLSESLIAIDLLNRGSEALVNGEPADGWSAFFRSVRTEARRPRAREGAGDIYRTAWTIASGQAFRDEALTEPFYSFKGLTIHLNDRKTGAGRYECIVDGEDMHAVMGEKSFVGVRSAVFRLHAKRGSTGADDDNGCSVHGECVKLDGAGATFPDPTEKPR